MATGRSGPQLWQLRSLPATGHGTTVLVLEGRLGHATAGELKAIVQSLDPSNDVVLDLSGVDYLSSAGLRVIEDLAAAQSGCGRELTVRSPSPAARLSLALSGLDGLTEPARSKMRGES